MSDTTAVKSNVFVEDLALATGGTGAVETGTRKTSTGGSVTLTKIDASHIKFLTFLGSVDSLLNGDYSITLKLKESIIKAPEVDARAYGTAGTQAAIIAALADIGSKQKTLVLYPSLADTSTTWSITADQTIPANVTLKVSHGAILGIAVGKTLTINGSLEAGLYQIFSCTGTGAVAGLTSASPEWFGTGAAAIQSCMASAHTTILSEGTVYEYTGAALYPPESHTIASNGPGAVLYRSDAGAGLYPYNYVTLRNFTLRGDGGVTYTAGAAGISSLYDSGGWIDPGGVVARSQTDMTKWRGAYLTIENLVVEDWSSLGIYPGPWSIIKDVVIQDCLAEGILIPGDYVQVINPTVKNIGGWGIDLVCSHTTVYGGYLYNCGDEAKFPADCGGLIVNSATQSVGTIGNKIIGTTIDTSDGPGIYVYAPTGNDYALTDTIISDVLVKNICVDGAGDIAGILIRDNSTSGTKLYRVNINNVIIDTVGSSGHGIGIYGAKDININNYNIKSVASKGIDIYPGAVGNWEGININNGIINGYNSAAISATTGSKLSINGYKINTSTAAGTYFGILLDAATKFSIGKGFIDLDSTGAKAPYGIFLTSTTGVGSIIGANVSTCDAGIWSNSTGDYVTVIGNDFSVACTTPIVMGGTITNWNVRDNRGYKPVPTTPAVPATTVEYRNTFGYPIEVVLKGGAGACTVVAKGMTSGALVTTGIAFTAVTQNATVTLQPGEYIALTYATAPTWVFYSL